MLTFHFQPFPILRSERLILRQLVHSDADSLFAMRSDPRVMGAFDRNVETSPDQSRELITRIAAAIAANQNITWAVSTPDQPAAIGTIGFWRIDAVNYRAEIGYMIHPDQQGKGYATEAVAMLIAHGFGKMKLHSIEANINPTNSASMKVLEKNGFVQEAYFSENLYHNGRFLDSMIFCLVNSDEHS